MLGRLALIASLAIVSHQALAAEWPAALDLMQFDMSKPVDQGRATSIIVAAEPACQGAVFTKELEVSVSPSAMEGARKGMEEGKALVAQALAADQQRLCRWIIERFGRHGSVKVDLRTRRMSDDVLGDHWAGLSLGRRNDIVEEIASNGVSASVKSKSILPDVMACMNWMTGTTPGADRETVSNSRSTSLNKLGLACRVRLSGKETPWKRK